MDAVKFLREKKKICEERYKNSCVICPLSTRNNGKNIACTDLRNKYPEVYVDIVEKWTEKDTFNRSRKGTSREPIVEISYSTKQKIKVYIAGSITGTTANHKQRSEEAETQLRRLGFEPINPDKLPENVKYKDAIKEGIKKLQECDAIYLIPGWEVSKGANLEKHFAEVLDKLILTGNLRLLSEQKE